MEISEGPKGFIKCSWLGTYHWCPIQVKMNIEGIEIVSKPADSGSGKHETIANGLSKGIKFKKADRKTTINELNKFTVLIKPETFRIWKIYKNYLILGLADLVFSIDGKCFIVDFKTKKKLTVYDADRLQLFSYLDLAKNQGLKNVNGVLCLTHLKKTDIRNKLAKMASEKGVERVVKFIENTKIFPVIEKLRLEGNEAILYEQYDRIIHSIENNHWEQPDEWKCQYCSTENCTKNQVR